MNYAMIIYLFGGVLKIFAALMAPPIIVALIYNEHTILEFFLIFVLCLTSGVLLTRKRPENDILYARDGFVAVSLIWIGLSLIGSLPFILSGVIPSVIDAIFESVSGFTTTGASILQDIESIPKSLLFWISFTHWLGGMGVLVLLLAILPLSSGHNFHLLRAESPGPTVAKLVPKLRTSAMILYLIYVGMTIIQVLLLLIAGMSFFDALLTAFGSASTGGLSFRIDSMASFSPTIQLITSVFMALYGVNFSLYYFIFTKKIKQLIRSEELRVYFGMMVGFSIIIAINIYPLFSNVSEAIRHSFFQVSSIISTTGFVTEDFNLWPSFSKTILTLLMCVGAMAGSTGGGLKISRIVIGFKSMIAEMFHLIHPHSVKKIKFEGKLLSENQIRSVNVYFYMYFAVFSISILIISLDNFDMITNFSAVTAALNNIGQGLEIVGPIGNFSEFSSLSKIVFILDMLIGRLEFLPILILFSHRTWKRK